MTLKYNLLLLRLDLREWGNALARKQMKLITMDSHFNSSKVVQLKGMLFVDCIFTQYPIVSFRASNFILQKSIYYYLDVAPDFMYTNIVILALFILYSTLLMDEQT